MLLRVTNLGPLREAELDLGKSLIVLVGPNNSGKTYLTWVAYSMARARPSVAALTPAIREWVDRLFAAQDQARPWDTLLGIRDDVLSISAATLLEYLPRDFAAPKERFSRTGIVLRSTSRDDAVASRRGSRVSTTAEDADIAIRNKPDDGSVALELLREGSSGTVRVSLDALDEDAIADAREHAVRLVVSFVLDAYVWRSYIALPVERPAINLFARELAANRTGLVDELMSEPSGSGEPTSWREQLRRRAGVYPLVVRDALQAAIRGPDRTERGSLADLADELEHGVLEGTVGFTSRNDIEFRPRDAKDVSLGLHESASVVKSLVSLALYLRYEARPGQRLVIDEPELNLHPDNQRRVARILAKAVNRGLKVMMSTHSDYIIRELNNLVMLGQGSEQADALGQELGYGEGETLQPDQLGAYLVNGGECRALPVTETGFEVETIEDEIHRLNRDSQTIYQRLFCD